MSGCSRWNSADGLQETSNCYCHPGIAGGSPADASNLACLPSVGLAFCAKVGNFDLKLTGMLNGGPISSSFSPDNTQDGGNQQGTFVGWEGVSPGGYSESMYDNHSGTTPGVLASRLCLYRDTRYADPGAVDLGNDGHRLRWSWLAGARPAAQEVRCGCGLT